MELKSKGGPAAGMVARGAALEMAKTKAGATGRIVAGEDLGWHMKLLGDGDRGYLVIVAKGPDLEHVFDCWVADEEMLKRLFKEAEWVVAWEL